MASKLLTDKKAAARFAACLPGCKKAGQVKGKALVGAELYRLHLCFSLSVGTVVQFSQHLVMYSAHVGQCPFGARLEVELCTESCCRVGRSSVRHVSMKLLRPGRAVGGGGGGVVNVGLSFKGEGRVLLAWCRVKPWRAGVAASWEAWREGEIAAC